MLLVDLDGFKSLNDQLGHAAGEAVLIEAATRLGGCVRPGDTLARLGGDEFVLVLPATTVSEGTAVADRILAALAWPLVTPARRRVRLGASIGVAAAQPHGPAPRQTLGDTAGNVPAASAALARGNIGGRAAADTAAELLQQADVAMYAAKRAGRGRREVFHPGLDPFAGGLLPAVCPAEARAWAAWMRALRAEIAQAKNSGTLPAGTRAPAGVHRTLEQVLSAIDDLPAGVGHSAVLTLPELDALQEFAFHQTAVHHWADALVLDGILTARRPAAADRFWARLAAAATGHAALTVGNSR